MPLSDRLLALTPLLLSATASATTLFIQPLDSAEQAYPLNSDQSADVELSKGDYRFRLDDGSQCPVPLGAEAGQRVRFNQPLPLTACAEAAFELKVRVAGNIRFQFDQSAATVQLSLLPKQTSAKPFVRPLPDIACPAWTGEAVTVAVNDVFSEGERVRDFYSGQTAQVRNGQITMTPAAGSNGLLLLESADHQPTAFSWDNLTVYLVMPDRFHNGTTENDHNFGRQKDGMEEITTFHGGDLKGLIEKLDYIEALGANAIWMTPIVEQVHGFIGAGEKGEFPFYPFHGYWALDYTRLDPNFGTDEDLRTLVKEAHARGIRLIWDAVINHAGYATAQDLVDFNIDVFHPEVQADNSWRPAPGGSWHDYNELINYQSPNWNRDWWDARWVRGTMPGYQPGGTDSYTKPLAGLPDYRTEDNRPVDLPPLLRNKADTRAQNVTRPVAEHLIQWQADWVRQFGLDGFRVDTVKHVESVRWQQLKQAGTEALAEWRAENPEQVLDDAPFWMVGEVYDHPLYRDDYYDVGFDSLINFSFQEESPRLAMCMDQLEPIYQDYAERINTDPSFNGLTYISSHDTKLFYAQYNSLLLQKRVAAPFLLLPGGVQIYYGDESAREIGPYGGILDAATRSDMNWSQIEGDRAELLQHWQTLGQFRLRHNAVGAGQHQLLSQSPYAFARTLGEDRVIVVFAGNEQTP